MLNSAELPTELDAIRIDLEEQLEEWVPPALDFNANELIEALFLEDAKPVVVFDASDPELIASRLLIALWPDIRRRFALSTFALSPRKINGRDLDLVFAPSNARAKFSDWPGRRVDGRQAQSSRHRWTEAITRRVFVESVPKLLSERETNLLGDRDADTASTLRIALLWDELLGKLDGTPTVALGLLDIANSGFVSNAAAVRSLEPLLAQATRRVADILSTKDAWDFVGAIVRKMQGHEMPTGRMAIKQLAANLAERAPDGAISLLQQLDSSNAIDELISSIAKGLGNGPAASVEQALVEAPLDIVAHLVSRGGELANRVAQDNRLIERMGVAMTNVDRDLADRVGMVLLPLLVEDRQLSAARPIFDKLDSEGIAAELRWLREANDFEGQLLCNALIDRAQEIKGLPAVRDALIFSNASPRRDALLERTVAPIATDIRWLLNDKHLSETTITALLVGVLRRADDSELAKLFSDSTIGGRMVELLLDNATDILARVALMDSLPMNTYIRVIQSVIPKVDRARKLEIAKHAMGSCLRSHFDGDVAILRKLFRTLGARVDGPWVARVGLGRDCDAAVASRNMIVFEQAPSAARSRIVGAIDEIARTLLERSFMDLTEAANDACARLMFDAEKKSRTALIDAAGLLMPSLMRARHQPVSPMIAVLFPTIYQELAKTNDVPDILKIFSFFDWDRCKIARHELVGAFMSSSWHAGDLALTAYRCGDAARILKRVAKASEGEEYLTRIENDLSRLDDDSRHVAMQTIAEIRSQNL